MPIIQISSGADSLTLRVHGRAQPDAQDYWNANWLHCIAEVSVGAFRGQLEWQLRNEDLARFMHGLVQLTRRAGVALLDTGDGWIDIQIIRDDQERVEALCGLEDNAGATSKFEFRLPLNESALLDLIRQLRDVLDRFPVVGKEET